MKPQQIISNYFRNLGRKSAENRKQDPRFDSEYYRKLQLKAAQTRKTNREKREQEEKAKKETIGENQSSL